jgi:broad specificity polyphosphatase/5'/3'-nucleotidase SurE
MQIYSNEIIVHMCHQYTNSAKLQLTNINIPTVGSGKWQEIYRMRKNHVTTVYGSHYQQLLMQLQNCTETKLIGFFFFLTIDV